jgi:hypothetical protein
VRCSAVVLHAALAVRLERDLHPEEHEPNRRADDDHSDWRVESHLLQRVLRHPRPDQPDDDHGNGHRQHESAVHGPEGTLTGVQSEVNYVSGEDYVVEFLGYRFGFNQLDFEERVTAAAVRLGLVRANDLDEDETADLVEIAADGRIAEARSGLGRYMVRHWERLALVNGESLVYWLRKLVFRSAWLDHRVKEGLLEVAWDDVLGDFGYAEPRGGRALLELAPVPSWHELQFRR